MIWTSRGQILRTMRPTRAPTPFTVNKVNRRALQFHLKNRIRITVLWIWVDKFRILRKLYEQKIDKSKYFLFQTIFIWDFDAIKYYLIKIQEFFSSRYWVAVFSGDLTVCTVSISSQRRILYKWLNMYWYRIRFPFRRYTSSNKIRLFLSLHAKKNIKWRIVFFQG